MGAKKNILLVRLKVSSDTVVFYENSQIVG